MDFYKLDNYLEKNTRIKNKTCFNIKTGREIKAFVPMHTFGNPVNIDLAKKIKKKYHLKLVEDAAEAIGSFYKKKHVGTFGDCGVLSFNGNKTITSGNGGALITNSKKLAKTAYHLSSTAKVVTPTKFSHDLLGYNYRMSNINSALGLAQIEKLNFFLKYKESIYNKYKIKFKNIPLIKIFHCQKNSKSNNWLITAILDKRIKNFKNVLLNKANKKLIRCRPAWELLSRLKIYDIVERMPDLSCSEDLYDRIISLPSTSKQTITKFLNKFL
jgi:perosamine synthetase